MFHAGFSSSVVDATGLVGHPAWMCWNPAKALEVCFLPAKALETVFIFISFQLGAERVKTRLSLKSGPCGAFKF